jgi:hypothetical protein
MPPLHDGKFTIPLYHGTNLLFYDSIRRHGLGGRNLIGELRVIEFLRKLIAICEASLPVEEDWILEMQMAKYIASQEVTGGHFNFRHGSAYLATSLSRAVRYAVSSEFGSEALAYFMLLWRRLHDGQITLPSSIGVDCRRIVEFASGEKAPLVLRLDGIALSALSAEDGGDPNIYLTLIKESESTTPVVRQAFLETGTFELNEPTPISDLNTFRVLKSESIRPTDYGSEYSVVPYFVNSTSAAPVENEVVRVRLL